MPRIQAVSGGGGGGSTGNADTLDGYHGAITPAASSVAVHDTSGILKSPIYAPQGFLINGKIVPSVASNNLTVAIKGLDGNDPSASNPVYCRIGDTIRSITAALSVTINAGTNWFNAGATDLATEEIDYFVYLGYNATDGVVVGFARIPYANFYSDFSTTSTADTYCAISTITNAAATDQYELIGRFNAILSATASFNWSIPATSIVLNRPIFETRWLVYNPILYGYSSGSAEFKYRVNRTIVNLDTLAWNGGTSNATSLYFSIPMATSVVYQQQQSVMILDNGNWQGVPGPIAFGHDTSLKAYVCKTTNYVDNFTNSGTKGFRCVLYYRII